MSRLCTELYRSFFNKIKDMTFDMEDFISKVSQSFEDIANVLNIGKCGEAFTAPQTNFNINGVSSSVVIYTSDDGFDDRPEVYSFRTGEGGSMSSVFYPKPNYKWNKDELEELKFLAENLFILGGRVQMLSAMRKIAVTDTNTGAANMNGFFIHCEEHYKNNTFKDYAVIFMNIKNFKFINRLAGERQGDIILRNFTHKLMNFMKDGEKVARPGGDNFCVLINKKRIEEFLSMLLNVSFAVKLPNENRVVSIHSRVGIHAVKDSDDVKIAVSAASTALNSAKKSGRSDVMWFHSDMLDKTLKANEVSNSFPEALRNNEFEVYYQPKVSLADNVLCGSEALSRWIRDGKIISPAEFIPVLEREGTICRLDFYVLDRVCSDIKRWLEAGIQPVRVSTNFSKLHLHDENFADSIIEIIKKHGVDPSYLEIELTESSGYEDYEALAEFVHKMKEFGISTSIDDFGTGYSSLNLLKDLEVDIIKLDKSFLDNLGSKKKYDEVLIKNIVNMVNELDMQVVAEGVETQFQAELLQNYSCSMAQGYLFDKPLPCEEFEKRLSDSSIYAVKRVNS